MTKFADWFTERDINGINAETIEELHKDIGQFEFYFENATERYDSRY